MRVLFVCVENSCRSQMAEGFAKALAKEIAKKPGNNVLEAASAGSRPSGVVNPEAIASMREAGIDLTSHRSKGLEGLSERRWDYAITMGCGDECPNLDARHREDWALPDPKHMEPEAFAKVRDEIRDRVLDLIARSGADAASG